MGKSAAKSADTCHDLCPQQSFLTLLQSQHYGIWAYANSLFFFPSLSFFFLFSSSSFFVVAVVVVVAVGIVVVV